MLYISFFGLKWNSDHLKHNKQKSSKLPNASLSQKVRSYKALLSFNKRETGTLNKVDIYCCLAIIPLALLDVNIYIMKGGNHCLQNLELPSEEELRATKAHSTVFLKQHATISTTETTAIRIMFNNEMRPSHVRNTLLGNYLNKKKKKKNFSHIFESKTKPKKIKYLYNICIYIVKANERNNKKQ